MADSSCGCNIRHFTMAATTASRSRGSVLVIVMLISFGLISIALYFANSMSMELRASDNRMSGLSADQAIEGAARYVGYILTLYATNGTVPDLTEYQAEAVPVGNAAAPEQNAHFWIIGRDPSGTPSSEPYFSLIDEGSKLNVNTANTNALSYLPNMTLDFADAIADWRSTNGVGTYALNYSQVGYTDKNLPFETVDELRLVYGATVDLLAGDDLNRNGVLDANEKSLNGGTTSTPGLFEYVTVCSREPNFHSDGTSLTNVNTPAQLRALLQANFPSLASRITANASYSSLLDFYLRWSTAGMTEQQFAQVFDSITVTNAHYTRGRVNINTASAPVLTALFEGIGIDQNTASGAAQSLVTYRRQNTNNLTSVAWIVDVLGRSSTVIQALQRGDYITTHSFQFTADIAATGAYGRGYRRVKFLFDISEGMPEIIYRQDLSRLGWALGSKTRETWVAQNTR
jgi:type II secretory pathway component PulK